MQYAVGADGDFTFKIQQEIAALMTVRHIAEDRTSYLCRKVPDDLIDFRFSAFHVTENHGSTTVKTTLLPEFFQKFGLEWLYRLVKEPQRWRRMIKLPLYLLDAVLWKFRGGK